MRERERESDDKLTADATIEAFDGVCALFAVFFNEVDHLNHLREYKHLEEEEEEERRGRRESGCESRLKLGLKDIQDTRHMRHIPQTGKTV